MDDDEDIRLDPVFNDEEDRAPLPIGLGPTLSSGELGGGGWRPRGG